LNLGRIKNASVKVGKMTEEQRAKYGTAHYDRAQLEEHLLEKFVDVGKKEQGVTIKVKTLEEQKQEEEREKQETEKKEAERKKAKKEVKEEVVLPEIEHDVSLCCIL
jgi:hypothetical protein